MRWTYREVVSIAPLVCKQQRSNKIALKEWKWNWNWNRILTRTVFIFNAGFYIIFIDSESALWLNAKCINAVSTWKFINYAILHHVYLSNIYSFAMFNVTIFFSLWRSNQMLILLLYNDYWKNNIISVDTLIILLKAIRILDKRKTFD